MIREPSVPNGVGIGATPSTEVTVTGGFYPKCVIGRRGRLPPSDWLHLKGLGPRLSSLGGDGSAPTLQPKWGSGPGLFKSEEPHQSTLKRTIFQHNLTIILTFLTLSLVQTHLDRCVVEVELLAWRWGVPPTPSLSRKIICFSVLRYKVCIHVASVSFFIFNNAELYL